jgi:hypothetical protein
VTEARKKRGFTTGPSFGIQGERLLWVDGAGRGSTVEMLVVTEHGQVFLYKGGAWSAVASDRQCENIGTCSHGAVLRTGPSKYVVGRPNFAGVFLADTSSTAKLHEVALPDPATRAVEFARDADGTIYASSSTPATYDLSKSPDGGSTWLPVLSRQEGIEGIVPFHGLVFFASRGELYHVSEAGDEPCDVGQFGEHIATSTVIGDTMVFGTDASYGSNSAPPRIIFATVRAPPAAPPSCY